MRTPEEKTITKAIFKAYDKYTAIYYMDDIEPGDYNFPVAEEIRNKYFTTLNKIKVKFSLSDDELLNHIKTATKQWHEQNTI